MDRRRGVRYIHLRFLTRRKSLHNKRKVKSGLVDRRRPSRKIIDAAGIARSSMSGRVGRLKEIRVVKVVVISAAGVQLGNELLLECLYRFGYGKCDTARVACLIICIRGGPVMFDVG